jgi:hypothetical protein
MRFFNIILSTLFFLLGNYLQGQTPWPITPTTESHNIRIPTKSFTPEFAKPFEEGDYIGFFYESTPGVYLCAGAAMNDGSDSLFFSIYGDDGINPGYMIGDLFKAKIYDSSQECETEFGVLTRFWGASVYTGGVTKFSEFNAEAPRLEYENTIFHKSNNLLIPVELLKDSPTEITNLIIKNTSNGLIAIDSAIINLLSSNTGQHYLTFSADQCLFEDSITLEIIDSPLSWEFQTSNSSQHTFQIDSLTLVSTENSEGTSDFAIQVGDIIGVFYDSLGAKYCGGYAVYDGSQIAIKANGYTPEINNGFQSELQAGSLQKVYFEIWDTQNNCTRHNTRITTNNNIEQYYYPDSLNVITAITYSPDTSFSYPQDEYISGETNPILNIPSTFTDWLIFDYSNGLLVDQKGEIDLTHSTVEQHYLEMEAYECMTSNTVPLTIVSNNNGTDLILAPTSEEEAYHSVHFPNHGKIDILDRNGLLVISLVGPVTWYGKGTNTELPGGDYFVQCQDGTFYVISLIK